MCRQLLTLPMGGTSSLDLMTRQFESGMLRLALQLASLWKDTLPGRVLSVAYSPNGQHIISGSSDKTIQIWNAETGSAVSKLLEVHTRPVGSVVYSPDEQYIISGSSDRAIHSWDLFPQIPSCLTSYVEAEWPDQEGWVRDPSGGLLYWVPHDCRAGLHSPALLTIPLSSPVRSVSLHFDEFAFGKSWTQISSTTLP